MLLAKPIGDQSHWHGVHKFFVSCAPIQCTVHYSYCSNDSTSATTWTHILLSANCILAKKQRNLVKRCWYQWRVYFLGWTHTLPAVFALWFWNKEMHPQLKWVSTTLFSITIPPHRKGTKRLHNDYTRVDHKLSTGPDWTEANALWGSTAIYCLCLHFGKTLQSTACNRLHNFNSSEPLAVNF